MSGASQPPATSRLELIAALAANGVIGRGGQLPWHLPDDLKRFKQLTMGHPIVMGRKTYESIGKPLPGRRNIVVSATMATPPDAGVEIVRTLNDAIALTASAGRVFVNGGAALYAAAVARADVMHLTELDEAVAGDVQFPAFEKSNWRLAEVIPHPPDARHAYGVRFCTYERIAK